jgi:hypothetical protein
VTQPADPTDRPLANVEMTVGWVLDNLTGDDLKQFESELPEWDISHRQDLKPAEADPAVKELGEWLKPWIDKAMKQQDVDGQGSPDLQ